MPLLTKRKLQRYFFPAIGLGFILLWLLSSALFWSNWNTEQQRIRDTLAHDAEMSLQGKATEIEGILQQIYHSVRTISLLPGVRDTAPSNRNSDDEDIVEMGLISAANYDTVQQLYNHVASSVALSEIYIVYDGFNPDVGQVPFLMFDHVIVDNFAKLTMALNGHHEGDFPEEDETEEYEDYVRQLDYLRQQNFDMPNQSLDSITVINSGLLRTCDNTQFLSKSHGHVKHTYGFTLSVPIYGLSDRQFKGLVTAVLRTNVLEAALVGWPVLPVTDEDRALLNSIRGLDLNTPPVNYLLEEQTNGIEVTDSRNTNFTTMQKTAAYHFEAKLTLSGPGNWVLHNYVPLPVLTAKMAVARDSFIIQVGILSVVLFLLWLAVSAVLKSQRNNASQLQELADIDPLTGLPNRRMIGLYLNTVLKTTKPGQCFAVIMIDLDDFKHVNDSMGHEAGDRMLIEIGHRFSCVLRNEDSVLRMSDNDSRKPNIFRNRAAQTTTTVNGVVGRLGGDEFLIILSELPDEHVVKIIIDRLMASLKDPIEIGIEKIYAHASMGVANYPNDGVHTATLLRNADVALYEAKRLGRGQSVTFSPALTEDALRRLKMMAGLHEALQEEQFFILYQPELHIESAKINAAEALLRWHHPDFGLVMPTEFIPMLERSGLINDVGRWVLREACLQLKTWQGNGLAMENIAVNISTKQLARLDFADMVAEILQDTGLKASNLVLEVTESSFMEEPELAIKALAKVRSLGVLVAIDDFGIGYSSLSYLQKIPLDILKIDRSFVTQTKTTSGLAICEMLIVLAERLSLNVIAEGVETDAQMQCLRGADWIQGYIIAKPLTSEKFEEKVRAMTK
ncbi:EAL domain-containing protein [uncultured Paraglaciecola sp.]|uniref:putative bifunctional diguanylate cyclase/phosphodiesterase n=1 Tax=uncultured Paraglaciecola sp. TaxID=1765024 RepID=UPI0030DAD05C|tara:strand:+ start:7048 stop:9591 length:2544 start_codon:yes stop_codon:yes gene_type:complete